MTANSEYPLRQQLIHYANLLESKGLSTGKSGNLSARCDSGILITPSAIEYRDLTPQHIVLVDLAGKPLGEQHFIPSSEWRFHCSLYQQRPTLQAIVHAHPNASTALACTGRNIPAFHYMVAVAGGKSIPLADYALFGSEQLSENILRAIGTANACLLANHGMIALGDSVAKAFNLALEVESLAEQYCRALQVGNVNLLSDNQMNEVIERFKHYGKRT